MLLSEKLVKSTDLQKLSIRSINDSIFSITKSFRIYLYPCFFYFPIDHRVIFNMGNIEQINFLSTQCIPDGLNQSDKAKSLQSTIH